ncbi:MAG: sensor histidine kinase [Ignavibacteriales bacterium]
MSSLIPAWASHYEEFWRAIIERNLWFIKLRYGAVAMLVAMLFGLEFILKIPLTGTQLTAIIIITLSILLYNIFFQYIRRFVKPDPDKFNNLHLSLLQIELDLCALIFLIYYTGGIENPLYMFFIFHMIIGSLILPGFVIYSISVVVVFLFALMIFGEYSGLIPHNGLQGLLSHPFYNNLNFIIIFLIVFSLMMFVSVTIANKIARELYKREQELMEALSRLKEAEIEKQKYIMGVVHEIKSPLTAVHSFLDLILGNFIGPVNQEISDRLNRAKIRTDEAINMINNSLRISRLRMLDDIGADEVRPEEVIGNIIEQYKATLEQKHICLNFFDNRESKAPLKADRALIEIAISNLIGNAIKYIGQENVLSQGKIEVMLKSDGENIFIEVCDNGVGIPREETGKVFNEFFRGSNIKHKNFEGSGMGLSVVHHIIQRHAGDIQVESPSRLGSGNNPGTAFIVRLPVSSNGSIAEKSESGMVSRIQN